MQWSDGNTVFEVGEANTDSRVGVSMGEIDMSYGYYIALEKHDIVRLRDWLNQAIEDLED